MGKKRRRTYQPVFVDIEPYREKPKMVSSTLLALNDKKRLNCPESYKKAPLKDFL